MDDKTNDAPSVTPIASTPSTPSGTTAPGVIQDPPAEPAAAEAEPAAEPDTPEPPSEPAPEQQAAEAIRSLVDTALSETSQAYRTATSTLQDATDSVAAAVDEAGTGLAVFNLKVIDIAQANFNASFEFAKQVATARSLPEVMELQSTFLRRQFEVMTAQAEEIQELSGRLASQAASPFQDHVAKSLQMIRSC